MLEHKSYWHVPTPLPAIRLSDPATQAEFDEVVAWAARLSPDAQVTGSPSYDDPDLITNVRITHPDRDAVQVSGWVGVVFEDGWFVRLGTDRWGHDRPYRPYPSEWYESVS